MYHSPTNLNVLKDMLTTSSIAAICVTGDTLTKIAIDTVNKKIALGDASVASPFTSRATSIKCTKDVLQREDGAH